MLKVYNQLSSFSLFYIIIIIIIIWFYKKISTKLFIFIFSFS